MCVHVCVDAEQDTLKVVAKRCFIAHKSIYVIHFCF